MPDQSQLLAGATTRLPERGAWVSAGSSLLFAIGLITIILAAIANGGVWAYRRNLATTQAKWEAQVKGQEEDLQSVTELIETSNALATVRDLLGNHVYTSNVFAFLQEVTHAQVELLGMGISVESRNVNLTGVASSYSVVAEQISVLEAHPRVENVTFQGLSLGERGLVNFQLSITFRPELLARPVAAPAPTPAAIDLPPDNILIE